jgi:glycosyltransferase involved in cell wall biosynthesis
VEAALRGAFGPRERPVQKIRENLPGPCDVVVSGLMNDPSGVGEGARAAVRGLRSAGYTASEHDIRGVLEMRIDRSIGLSDGPNGLWVLSCNPPELFRLFASLRPSPIGRRYRVGFWAWELERLPSRWASAAAYLDEIWVPSRFVGNALKLALERSHWRPIVRVVPLPVDIADIAMDPDEASERGADGVSILVMFDLNSSRARKNPDAAIDAYCSAFPEPARHRRLVCKVNGAQKNPNEYNALRKRYTSRPDVVFMDGVLTRFELARFIGQMDIVLSTHRSEGYGLVLAEAISLGKCVMATGWSGNIDFMDETNSILIPYTLVRVQDPQNIYPSHSMWADVDVEVVAGLLLHASADISLREKLGAKAKTDMVKRNQSFAAAIRAQFQTPNMTQSD